MKLTTKVTKVCGHGTIIYRNGDVYDGSFYNSLPVPGGGRMTFKEDWKLFDHNINKKQVQMILGEGVIFYRNGNCYRGMLQDNSPHGHGTMTFSNGAICKGIWKKGDLMRRDFSKQEDFQSKLVELPVISHEEVV